jgi:hypothetical protein
MTYFVLLKRKQTTQRVEFTRRRFCGREVERRGSPGVSSLLTSTSSLLTYSLSRTSTTFDFCNVYKNVVKLLMINVCGLVKRIQYPEFMELIEGYDIL